MNEPMREESRTTMHEAVKCQNCCHWKSKSASGMYGDCYRDPPTPIGLEVCQRPETRNSDWCCSWTQAEPTPREVVLERMLNGFRRDLDADCSAEAILVDIKLELEQAGFFGKKEPNDHSEGGTGP